ncbi:MAG: glycosyltransferase [Lachnospiraceae bacterium]|nr:glycosyltransferase [Lachnospiraceae bacterium]
MVGKKMIQKGLTVPYEKAYRKELNRQEHIYDIYVEIQEDEMTRKYEVKPNAGKATVCRLPEMFKYAKGVKCDSEILIFHHPNGILNKLTDRVIIEFFQNHPGIDLVYADEDVCVASEEERMKLQDKNAPASRRCCPFLKPIPAYETFLSFNYIQNIWAIRKSKYDMIVNDMIDKKVIYRLSEQELENESTAHLSDLNWEELCYDFLLRAWEFLGEDRIARLPKILFHKFEDKEEESYDGASYSYDTIKNASFARRGILARMCHKDGYSYPVYGLEGVGEKKISIIIPSKDNPFVLGKCLSSIRERSTYRNYEIIVIDNGSTEDNFKLIQGLQRKYAFTYIYKQTEFNFSAMNNRAVKEARGEYVLFLNDDMEVVTRDWMELLLGQAAQDGVGAVGAKLLYPDGKRIQHVGITNAVDGPVHKLLGHEDEKEYHYGRNRLVYNTVGVTGACLLIHKALFEKVGGFNEELRVAYNDVELCFSLLERGYRNVVRNDVVLYHHESLSRGADSKSKEKMSRLKWERDKLYSLHPQYYRMDPYEGGSVTGGSDFGVAMELHYTKKKNKKDHARMIEKDYSSYPSGVAVVFDRIEKERHLLCEGESFYVLEGYAVVADVDNCRYTFEMILDGLPGKFVLPMQKMLRSNLERGFPGAKNLRLSGFSVKIEKDEIPPGEYEVSVFATDHCSRRRLYQPTGEVIKIESR